MWDTVSDTECFVYLRVTYVIFVDSCIINMLISSGWNYFYLRRNCCVYFIFAIVQCLFDQVINYYSFCWIVFCNAIIISRFIDLSTECSNMGLLSRSLSHLKVKRMSFCCLHKSKVMLQKPLYYVWFGKQYVPWQQQHQWQKLETTALKNI